MYDIIDKYVTCFKNGIKLGLGLQFANNSLYWIGLESTWVAHSFK